MSDTEFDNITRLAETGAKLVKAGRTIIGAFVALMLAIGGVAIWVSSTNDALAQTKADILRVNDERKESLKDWTDWRRQVDNLNTRLVTIMENQQKQIDRIESDKHARP